MLKVIFEFGSDDRRKNPRVVRFDHWGAAKSGLQLGEIERAFMQPARRGGWRALAR